MKQRILFLAANPVGTTALQLDEEARAIQEEILRAKHRDVFEFSARLAARPLDLLRASPDAMHGGNIDRNTCDAPVAQKIVDVVRRRR